VSDTRLDPRLDPDVEGASAGGPSVERSRADRLARRILRIEDEVPGALFPMRGSLVLSAVRCLVTYVAIPLLVPVFGWLTPLAAPLSLVLTVVAGAMAITSLRRVWAANWSGRWGYTAFAVTVLLALAGLLVVDLAALAS
jgi:hypothetical protein